MFKAYEVRAAIILMMAAKNILALPASAESAPPSKWPWTDDHTAAFRAFADRHGYVFSQQPDFGKQSAEKQNALQFIIVNDVRKREAALADKAVSAPAAAPQPVAPQVDDDEEDSLAALAGGEPDEEV